MAKYAAERDFHSFIIPSLAPCPRPRKISSNLSEILHKPVKDCPFQNDKKNNVISLPPRGRGTALAVEGEYRTRGNEPFAQHSYLYKALSLSRLR